MVMHTFDESGIHYYSLNFYGNHLVLMPFIDCLTWKGIERLEWSEQQPPSPAQSALRIWGYCCELFMVRNKGTESEYKNRLNDLFQSA